jgi:hypothetical protein
MKYAIWKRMKEDNQKIAKERVTILDNQIKKHKDEPDLVKRYTFLIGRLLKKYRLSKNG